MTPRADSIATGDLPADPEAVRTLLLANVAERDAAIAARDSAVALWLKLRRMQFGPRSERLPEEQLALGLEDLETAISQTTAEAERGDPALRHERAKKQRASRGALPAHLQRIEVVLMPCPCCKAIMVEIGEDRSERAGTNPNFPLWHYFKWLRCKEKLPYRPQNVASHWLHSGKRISSIPCN